MHYQIIKDLLSLNDKISDISTNDAQTKRFSEVINRAVEHIQALEKDNTKKSEFIERLRETINGVRYVENVRQEQSVFSISAQ